MGLDRLDALEQKVGSLIKMYEVLGEENRKLADELEFKEEELKKVRERLNRIESEKGLIKENVEGILGKIDGLMQNA